MTDENTTGAQAAPTTDAGDAAQDVSSLPAWAQDMIRDLRREAADRRVAAKQADAQREDVLAEVQPKAERTDAMEAFLRDLAQKRMDALPSQYRALVPQYDDALQTLQWLEASAAILLPPRAPGFDAGVTGDRPAAVPEEVRALAQRMGVSVEKVARVIAGQK